MHKLDTSFKESKEKSRAQKMRKQRKNLVIAGLICLFVIAGGGIGYLYQLGLMPELSFGTGNVADNFDGSGVDEPNLPAQETAFVPVIVDLPGDPLVINLGSRGAGGGKAKSVSPPANADIKLFPRALTLVSDQMISSSKRFITTLPSSQEDFAFFQQQSGGARQDRVDAPDAPSLPTEEIDVAALNAELDTGAGWGETLSDGQVALPEIKQTRIQNTTSVAAVRVEELRYAPIADVFVKVLTDRQISDLLIENRFSTADAKEAEKQVKEQLSLNTVSKGFVVAMRGVRETGLSEDLKLVQMSIYNDEAYLGTLAKSDEGSFISGADPWVREELFNYSENSITDVTERKYRLLDAFYSTTVRNKVPTGVVSEAIMHMSRIFDLNKFATTDDRMVLLYARTGRGEGKLEDRVLYLSIKRKQSKLECFVFRPKNRKNFRCFNNENRNETITHSGANGMVTPVKGVMTSKFGPRTHPILKTVRIHKGVDWAAPSGTPVYAAFDGKVIYAGDGRGYGNLLRIQHSRGRETRYAHLSRFDAKSVRGNTVTAGEVVGYVGTTGLSTGPHLHFEYYVKGTARNPLAAGPVYASTSSDGGGAGAIDALVDQIIQVESGGNAKAKNSLSTATGLGQFIDSTWLTMMKQYRPDLARSLGRQELLKLRFDPTISREMVRNLAREGESYLRARGHKSTPGNLYLAHFLGKGGAHKALSSPPDAMLIDVFGKGVINANPFLAGKDVAYVINWAARKMNRKERRIKTPKVFQKRQVVTSAPGLGEYKKNVADILKAAGVSI